MAERTFKEYEEAINEITSGLKTWEACQKDSRCDKKNMGFNLDERFSAHEPIKIRLTSWKGYYGNSGCSTIFNFRGKLFEESLIEYLNVHRDGILEWIVNHMKSSSELLRKREIETVRARLQELERMGNG